MSTNRREIQEQMDAAAKGLKTEFRGLLNTLNLEQAHSIALLIELIIKYRDTAGYKRMFHHMFKERGTIQG